MTTKKPIEQVINLPRTKIEPVNQRVYCRSFPADEIRTKGGLILPTAYKHQEAKQTQMVGKRRFLVAAIAKDVSEVFKNLKRGDEVYPIGNPDAVAISWPTILDFSTGEEFEVFHESELQGFIKAPDEAIEEKD